MDLAEEFRTRAQRCLDLAHEAPTLEAQTHWLSMAQLWFSLAEHSEEQDARLLERPGPATHSDGAGDGSKPAGGEDEEFR